MFERYNEKSRRLIFFARYEASRYGASTITPEHLLLAYLRDEEPLLQKLIAPEQINTLKTAIEWALPREPKVSTAADMPLSLEMKRILLPHMEKQHTLANQEEITPAHILLSLLREPGTHAARLARAMTAAAPPAARAALGTGNVRRRGAAPGFPGSDRSPAVVAQE